VADLAGMAGIKHTGEIFKFLKFPSLKHSGGVVQQDIDIKTVLDFYLTYYILLYLYLLHQHHTVLLGKEKNKFFTGTFLARHFRQPCQTCFSFSFD
jgi:hypothetical protein